MTNFAFRSCAATAGFAALLATLPATAGIVGSTYAASITGTTLTRAFAAGTYTDPSGLGFCVGGDGCSGSGFGGGFTFADISPTRATITFNFFGGYFLNPTPFTITLGDFVTLDGSTVADISYRAGSGSIITGSFGLGLWDGRTASFTAAPSGGIFSAVIRQPFVFDVTLVPGQPAPQAVPEPSTLALAAGALFGLVSLRRRR